MKRGLRTLRSVGLCLHNAFPRATLTGDCVCLWGRGAWAQAEGTGLMGEAAEEDLCTASLHTYYTNHTHVCLNASHVLPIQVKFKNKSVFSVVSRSHPFQSVS